MTPENIRKVLESPYTKKYKKRVFPVISWIKYDKSRTEFCIWNLNRGEMNLIEYHGYGDIPGMNFRNLCKIKEYEYHNSYIVWTRNSGDPFSLCSLNLKNFSSTNELEKIFNTMTNNDGNTYINHYNLFCESLGQLVLQGDIDEIRIAKIEEQFSETINIIRKDFLHNIISSEKNDVTKFRVIITDELGNISKKISPYDIDYLTMIQYV